MSDKGTRIASVSTPEDVKAIGDVLSGAGIPLEIGTNGRDSATGFSVTVFEIWVRDADADRARELLGY